MNVVVVVKNKNFDKKIITNDSRLIFLSAFLFVASFYSLVVGLFLFLIPLYSVFLQKKLSFLYGLIWGIIFFGFHSLDFFYVVYHQGYGFFRLIYPTVFVLYCALFPGLWFLSITWLQKRYQKHQECIWIACSFLYFVWIDTGLLFPFGRFEGNPLCFVLLPLFYKPVCAQIIGIIGKWITVFLLIFLNTGFAELYFEKKMKKLGTCIVFLILLQLVTDHTIKKMPTWFDNIVVIDVNKSLSSQERFEDCLHALSKSNNKVFILPESSLPTFKTKRTNIISLLQQNLLAGATCIFGTHTKKEEKLYNSFIFCDSSRIIHTYEKTHLIPFFEYNPYKFFKYEFFFNFFLHKRMPFTFSKNGPIPLKNNKIGPFLPVICSELFWDTQRKEYPRIPLICIANDSYFMTSGYRKFMLLAAQLIALSEQRAIVYVSWSEFCFVSQQGYLKRIEKLF